VSEESRVNSRLGPVSELTGARRFSGRAEPRLQPRLAVAGAVGRSEAGEDWPEV